MSNLQRLAHFAEDRYKEYETKKQRTIDANSQILTSAPFALATMVDALLIGECGIKQVRDSSDSTSPI